MKVLSNDPEKLLLDKEAVQALDVKLKDERKQAGEKGLYFAGLLLFHTAKYDKAREYVDRMLKLDPNSKQVYFSIIYHCSVKCNGFRNAKFFFWNICRA